MLIKLMIGVFVLLMKIPSLILVAIVIWFVSRIIRDVKEESPTGRLVQAAKDWKDAK